jgi:hypothetical protein
MPRWRVASPGSMRPREIERFDARAERPRKGLAEATEQAGRLKRAVAVLSNGAAPEKSRQD